MRFKKFTWNWTSFIVGIHAGRNPVSGKRFMYIGLGPFLGMDFHWPEDSRVTCEEGNARTIPELMRSRLPGDRGYLTPDTAELIRARELADGEQG